MSCVHSPIYRKGHQLRASRSLRRPPHAPSFRFPVPPLLSLATPRPSLRYHDADGRPAHLLPFHRRPRRRRRQLLRRASLSLPPVSAYQHQQHPPSVISSVAHAVLGAGGVRAHEVSVRRLCITSTAAPASAAASAAATSSVVASVLAPSGTASRAPLRPGRGRKRGGNSKGGGSSVAAAAALAALAVAVPVAASASDAPTRAARRACCCVHGWCVRVCVCLISTTATALDPYHLCCLDSASARVPSLRGRWHALSVTLSRTRPHTVGTTLFVCRVSNSREYNSVYTIQPSVQEGSTCDACLVCMFRTQCRCGKG